MCFCLLWNCFLVSHGTHVMNTPKNHIWKRNFETKYKKRRGEEIWKKKQKGEKENTQNSFTLKDPKIA